VLLSKLVSFPTPYTFQVGSDLCSPLLQHAAGLVLCRHIVHQHTQNVFAASIDMLRGTVTAMAVEPAPSLVAVRKGPVPLLLLLRVLMTGDRDSYTAAALLLGATNGASKNSSAPVTLARGNSPPPPTLGACCVWPCRLWARQQSLPRRLLCLTW
jgi:hypothetical protein